MIEARVMRDEQTIAQPRREVGSDIGEAWISAAVRLRRERRFAPELAIVDYPLSGIEQRAPLFNTTFIEGDDTDFGDTVARMTETGRFDVDECESAPPHPTIYDASRRRISTSITSSPSVDRMRRSPSVRASSGRAIDW